MTRLAIIDHGNHTLYVEDVTDEQLEAYGGSEQAYIDDNYSFDGDYSWDNITDALYSNEDVDLMDLDIDNWL